MKLRLLSEQEIERTKALQDRLRERWDAVFAIMIEPGNSPINSSDCMKELARYADTINQLEALLYHDRQHKAEAEAQTEARAKAQASGAN